MPSAQTVTMPAAVERQLSWRAFVPVALTTIALHLALLGNGFVVWDDDQNFLANPHYRGFGGEELRWMFTEFHLGHYQPLSWLTLALDFTLGGMNPCVYHLTNVLWHALTALLFALLVATLTRERGGEGWSARPARESVAFASAVALLWAAHPLRVEAVGWITQRREVLCGALTLATLLHHARGGGRIATAGLAALAMLSKATAVVLPALLVLLDVHRAGGVGAAGALRVVRASLVRHAPVVALAAGCSILALKAQAAAAALVDTAQLSWIGRATIYLFGAGFYVWKSIWPSGLAPLHYGRVGMTWEFQSWVQTTAIVAAFGIAALLGLGWRARRLAPALLTLLVAYLAMLLPVGGLGQSGAQIAGERYAYQPGWVLTLGMALLLDSWLTTRLLRRVVFAAALLACALLSVRQQFVWRDTESLWQRQLEVYPGHALASYQLGLYLKRQDLPRLTEAEELLRTAVASAPEHVDARCALAEILAGSARQSEALEQLDTALRFRSDHKPSLVQRAHLLWAADRRDESIAAFERLASVDAQQPEAYRLWARALAAHGRGLAAVAVLQRGLDATSAPTLALELAWMLATNPDDTVRDGRRAVELAERVASSSTLDARTVLTFAIACAESGDFARADRVLAEALPRLPPNTTPALTKLREQLAGRDVPRVPPMFP